jgi:signal peptidase I
MLLAGWRRSKAFGLLAVLLASAACGTAGRPHSNPTPSALPSPHDPEQIRIEGEAMLPVLANGDVAIADRGAYADSSPQRGDLIVFQPPDSPRRLFVKRVIGLPGDRIEIDGRYSDPAHPDAPPRTAILVQPGGRGAWQTLLEPYLPDQYVDPWTEMSNCCDATGRATAVPTQLSIPEGSYFVLGDNRNRSADSRSLGVIPVSNIAAKLLYRVRAGSTSWLYGLLPHLSPSSSSPSS